jgi:hypothetical protein
MENRRPDWDTAWVHIGHGEAEVDISSSLHGGRKAGPGHEQDFT